MLLTLFSFNDTCLNDFEFLATFNKLPNYFTMCQISFNSAKLWSWNLWPTKKIVHLCTFEIDFQNFNNKKIVSWSSTLQKRLRTPVFFLISSNQENHLKISPERQLIKLISKVSRSYITTHVADENTAVFRWPLLGQQIETHRHDVAAITERHAGWCSVVAGMNGAAIWAVEENLDVHRASFTCRGDLRREIYSILRLNLRNGKKIQSWLTFFAIFTPRIGASSAWVVLEHCLCVESMAHFQPLSYQCTRCLNSRP